MEAKPIKANLGDVMSSQVHHFAAVAGTHDGRGER